MSNRIFLVRVPETEINRLRELRDHILESLSKGVLVLPEDATHEVIELPPIDGVKLELGEEALPPEPEAPAPTSSEAKEKQTILQRLIDYRSLHGLGTLEAVAQKTAHNKNVRLSSDTLRRVLAGDIRLSIDDWRKIGRALDRLEGGDG